jgi:hypothetical protein
MLDTEQVERPLAQLEDVLGAVGEEVARVLVPLSLAADQSLGPVGDPTPVGVEQSAQEAPRVLFHDGRLPGLQHDGPLVLVPRAMLGKETWPVLPSDRGDSTPGPEALMDPRARLHGTHGIRHLAAVDGVATIVEDGEQIDASAMCGDGPVAEVPAQKVGVGARIRQRGTLTSGTQRETVVTTPGESLTLVEASPPTHRLDRHSADLRDLRVDDALVGQRQTCVDNRL